MVDVSFKINCPRLSVDHATALSESLFKHHGWVQQLPHTGIHPIHVAGSQNGWQRPENPDDELLLSKRTRLKIRINSTYADKLIETLKNTTHTVDNHELEILDGRITLLKPSATLFSRFTVYLKDRTRRSSEDVFVQRVINECNSIGYKPTKILCGRTSSLSTTDGPLSVQSLLLADVPEEFCIPLQEQGLGDFRLHGCGVLIPHKDTGAVN